MNALTAIPGPPAAAGALSQKSGRSSPDEQTSIRHASRITTRGVLALAFTALASSFALANVQADADVGPPTVADYDAVLDRAVEAFDKQDYPRARVLFERALALRPNARVLRGLGIAALHLKRFTAAKHELTAALADPRQPLTASQREGVTDILAWMQSHLGTLELQLSPANARIALDGETMPATTLVMEPGEHRLRVSADGFDPQEHSIRIDAGEARTFDVSLLPRPAEVPAISAREVAHAAPRPASERALDATQPRDSDSSSVLERWWFWTAVGVVVAGGIATTLVLTREPSPSFEKGGLGGVIMPLGRLP